jgi:anti-anti-sigma regulatory factor
MASNFQVDVIRRDPSSLYVRIIGDLDGASAYRLLNLIEKDKRRFRKITIDTNALRKVHAFGSDILGTNMRGLKNNGVDIVFIGRFKKSFVSE